jgi:hypothetical protein
MNKSNNMRQKLDIRTSVFVPPANTQAGKKLAAKCTKTLAQLHSEEADKIASGEWHWQSSYDALGKLSRKLVKSPKPKNNGLNRKPTQKGKR